MWNDKAGRKHLRVKGIVSGQHRAHYGRAAALAAALGEVKESRGGHRVTVCRCQYGGFKEKDTGKIKHVMI